MISGKQYGPEDVWTIVRRHKWLIIVPFVVASAVTILVTRTLPNRYRTDTLILVVPQRVPESYVRSTVTTRIEDRLPSIAQQILGRTRLERIVRDLDLYKAARATKTMDDVIDQMRRDIDVEVVKGDSFRITYTGDQPKTVMDVTQRLASLFIDENLHDREALADQSYQFLDSQLDEARKDLVAHEKKIEGYRMRYSGQLPTQMDSNLRVIQNAQIQIQGLNESMARDVDRRLIIERALADLNTSGTSGDSAPSGAGDDEVQKAVTQLQEAQDNLHNLELRLKPEHPDLLRARRTVAELTAKVEQIHAQPHNPARAAVPLSSAELARQNRLNELRAELENINRQIARREQAEKELRATVASYQSRVEAAPTRETELIELTRDYDTKQKAYVALLAKQEDAKISANLERRQAGEQFRVLDPARIPERPISPNRVRLNVLGSLAGLAFGLALIALLEWTDSTLKTDDDVLTALSLPVLALVPLMTTANDMRHRRFRHLLAVASAAAVSVAAALVAWKLKS